MTHKTHKTPLPSAALPDHGVQVAGRFRRAEGDHDYTKVAHNFGPDRVSFGLDPAKPHAKRMKAKDTPARHNMVGVLAHNESGAIRVQQWRCAMVRNRNANCMRCADACTSACIGIQDGALVVDETKCVGCGTCATVCPTCALESFNPTDATLLQDCLDVMRDGRVSIVCHPCAAALAQYIHQDACAQVVCLGRVDESLICELAAHGAREVVLSCGQCSNCAQQPGHACAQDVVETANALLDAWNSDCRAYLVDGVPEYVCDATLRPERVRAEIQAYFATPRGNDPIRTNNASNEGRTSSTQAVSSSAENTYEVLKVMKDGTLPHFIPARHERLLDSLAALGTPGPRSISTRLWGAIDINMDLCVSCRMCATFCPTGAIAKFGEQDSDNFGVKHYSSDCVNCGTCQAICPQDAITLVNTVQADSLLGGSVKQYAMLPRAVAMNNTHQIVNTMRSYIDGDIFER